MRNYLLSTLACIMISFPAFIHGQDPGSCNFNYGVYSEVTTMPVKSCNMATGVIDGKIYMTAGFDLDLVDSVEILVDHLSVYDPQTNTWDTTGERLPVPRYMDGAQNAVLDGKLYLVGGSEWAWIDNGWEIIPYARVDVYDPQSDTWESKANLPVPLGGNGVCSLDGKIYVTGGITNENIVLSSFYSYDPASDSWEELTEMPAPRNGHVSVALDGRIYVIGGGSSFLTESTSCEVYDTVTDQWTSIAPLPIALINSAGCVVGEEIYIFGGQRRSDIRPDAFKYNPEEDTWIRIDDLDPDRKNIAAVPIGRTIYLIGGRPSGYVVSDLVEAFELGDIVLDSFIPDTAIDDGGLLELDLSEYFSHVDGGEITYSVCLDVSGIVEASVDGSMLTVTRMATGDAEVSILAESGEDQMGDTFQINVYTGIDEVCEIPPVLQIYPNPSSGMATLAYSVQSPGMVRLEVSDLTGKRISIPLNEYRMPGEYEYQFNTGGLMPGIYFCELITPDQQITVKLVVEH